MKFADLLKSAIQRSEIPLRFEPGAEEAVAKPVMELVRAWLEAHRPVEPRADLDLGRDALITELVDELTGARDLPTD
ncbi:MAG TPA: hypothetical protein VMR62_03125 [Bryobacteraceae bacterium]|jgi:hypothetical protein|nr:hypothetical protein [Bryobacteraceae bacterium]